MELLFAYGTITKEYQLPIMGNSSLVARVCTITGYSYYLSFEKYLIKDDSDRRVEGDLLMVPKSVLKNLDKYLGCGFICDRLPIKVVYAGQAYSVWSYLYRLEELPEYLTLVD